MGREDAGKQERVGGSDRNAAEAPASASPEAERARRYLDLWERNLSYLALNGPALDGPAFDDSSSAR